MSEEPIVEPDGDPTASTKPIPVAEPAAAEPAVAEPEVLAPVANTPPTAPEQTATEKIAPAQAQPAQDQNPAAEAQRQAAAPAGTVPAGAVPAAVAPGESVTGRGPWWHYLVVGVIGVIIGALICGGLLGISDHFRNGRFGNDHGRFQRFHRQTGPGGWVVPGGSVGGPGGVVRVRPGPMIPARPAAPVPPTNPLPAPSAS